MRAAELAGLQVGDLQWPVNPSGQVYVRVRRTVIDTGDGLTYDTTKTRGSDRHDPVMPHTAQLLRDYLTEHPRADEPTAPLFCSVTLAPVKPSGKRAETPSDATADLAGESSTERKPETAAQKADRQSLALAELSVGKATSGWFWTGLSRCVTRRSKRRCSGQRCCVPVDWLARVGTPATYCQRDSSSTACDTCTPVLRGCRDRRCRRERELGSFKGDDDAGYLHAPVPYR